jgi:hypothetical protein
VYLNNSTSPSISGNYTLPNTTGYFGFTGSTGTGTISSAQYIKSISIKNAAPIRGTTSICQNQTTTLTNAVSGGTWTSSNPTIASINSSGLVTAGSTAGNTTITYTLPASCGSQTSTTVVTVNQIPTVNVINNQTDCNGVASTAVSFSGTPLGTTFNWTNTNTNIGLPANGSGNIPSFITSDTSVNPISATITVTPSYSGCVGTPKTFTYTVNPTPTVNQIPSQTLCYGSATDSVKFVGTIAGTVFNWTNSNTAINLLSSGSGNIPSFVAYNTTTNTISATITVTPTANSCSGSSKTFNIVVKPTPNVNQPNDQILCNGIPTNSVSFLGSVPNAVYSWTSNNTAIGLGGSGTGNIPGFTAVNVSSAPIYTTLTVTPSYNGCIGTPRFFHFIVNPTPDVNPISAQSLCNAFPTNLVSFSGPITGTTFTWSNNDTTVGLGLSGNNSVPIFNVINNTSHVIIDTITVTPWLNTCDGPKKTYTYIIKPTPTVNFIQTDSVCNGIPTVPIALTGPVVGTSFNWINNKPQIGLTAGGNGDIPSFTPVDTAVSPYTANIIVTPTADGCLGVIEQFNIISFPTPKVSLPISQTVCNGKKTVAVNFSGNFGWSSYHWVNDDTTIGLSNSGIGKILPFKGINLGNTPKVATLYVTPIAHGCPGPADTFSITISPTPIIQPISSQTVCNNDSTVAVIFGSSVVGTTYNWMNNLNTIGIADSGSGNMPSFIALNPTINPQTAKVTVTPTSATCVGASGSYTYTINPTPNVNQPLDQSVCHNQTTKIVNFSGSVYGTTYTWANDNITIGLGASGAGNVASFMGINPDTSARVGIVTVTPHANSCIGPSKSIVYTINPLPIAATIDIKPPVNMCSNTQYQNFGSLTPLRPDQFYTWSALNGNVMNSGKDSINSLINFPYPAHATVTLTTTFKVTRCSNTSNYGIDVAINHIFVPTMVYHNNYFVCLENDVDNYYWGYDDVTTLDSTLIPDQHNQYYYVQNPDFANKYYWVIPTKGSCWQKTYYNQPAGIDNLANDSQYFSIYPNPTEDVLNIKVSGNLKNNASLKLMDIYGKELTNFSLTDKRTSLNVKEYPAGMYLLMYYENGIQLSSQKFIKK